MGSLSLANRQLMVLPDLTDLGSVARLPLQLPRLQSLRLQRNRLRRVDRLGDLLHLQFLDVSENLLGPSPGAALQMIGNCCKLTVICVAGNPFVDDTCLTFHTDIELEQGDYRYQLIDLCPSLRMVDGEETWAVKGSKPGIQLSERLGCTWVIRQREGSFLDDGCILNGSAGKEFLQQVIKAYTWYQYGSQVRVSLASAVLPDQTRPQLPAANPWEGFLLEIEILRAMKPFSDFCRRPEASFQELRPWYSCLIAGLKRCSNFQSTFNCAAFSSFHLPLLRLLSSCMHWELLQNAEQPGDWRELFPSDFLVHTMTHLVRTLRFEAEIQNGLWVRNGQSMHKQQSDYRQNLRQWDILAFQACMLLMDLYEEAEPLACLWTAAFEEKGSGCSVSALDSWKRLWSDEVKVAVQLRFRLFWTVLAQALNEMMPIEVSLCRRRWESRYARCSVILQRFFIQILAKPMSVAELTPLIPKELQAREPQVTEVLDLVALRKDQKFQLKAKSWAYFDCLMASTPAEFDWTCMVWRQMGLAS
ncbi:BTB and MATH domain-containing protein 40 [Durusdinium trenchii]|uniref:E3 ubiquitin-protein ligase n=1 Tax=Durusdinium trenchii TaxID=1381693 RepID=A0ABP0QH68_9DINO